MPSRGDLGRGALRRGAPRSVVAADSPLRRALRRSSTPGLALYAVLLGAGLGLAGAERATRGDYPFGGVQAPPWTAWPRVGGRADPYARAIHARRGDIPLATGEGVAMTTGTDGAGRPLDPACTYRVAGETPPARLWTLTVYDGTGAPVRSALGRSGFTSAEVLREASGRFAITLSRTVQPGNWLPLPAEPGPVGLVLRLYDTPVGASAGAIDPRTVPTIERTGCAG